MLTVFFLTQKPISQKPPFGKASVNSHHLPFPPLSPYKAPCGTGALWNRGPGVTWLWSTCLPSSSRLAWAPAHGEGRGERVQGKGYASSWGGSSEFQYHHFCLELGPKQVTWSAEIHSDFHDRNSQVTGQSAWRQEREGSEALGHLSIYPSITAIHLSQIRQ